MTATALQHATYIHIGQNKSAGWGYFTNSRTGAHNF